MSNSKQAYEEAMRTEEEPCPNCGRPVSQATAARTCDRCGTPICAECAQEMLEQETDLCDTCESNLIDDRDE